MYTAVHVSRLRVKCVQYTPPCERLAPVSVPLASVVLIITATHRCLPFIPTTQSIDICKVAQGTAVGSTNSESRDHEGERRKRGGRCGRIRRGKKYTGLYTCSFNPVFNTVHNYEFVECYYFWQGMLSHFITEIIIHIFALILSSLNWSVAISKCKPVETLSNCCHTNCISYPLCRHSYKLPVNQISCSKIQATNINCYDCIFVFSLLQKKKHISWGRKSAAAYECDLRIRRISNCIFMSFTINCTYMGLYNVITIKHKATNIEYCDFMLASLP